ncbi:MAG: ABC transporter ATP-binding protein [Deltaproteobacteria bacterium]|jgi:putative ABC transport system ATP-binding protein|nr:ABC transporter ATP-binding protein [Deltaproteobacteria bacterium]
MLRINQLVKSFFKGTINEVLAMNGLNLNVKPGEFVSIIGSNGAGKSSLMNCIAGAYTPDSGQIILDGSDITLWPEYRRSKLIGRVFQDPLSGTCASMTIEENMALAYRRGKTRGLSRGMQKSEREFFREALSRLDLGLESRLQDAAGLLSGGQRQSLTLLMATLVRPTLLLLDEHTAALDPKTARLTMNLTQELVETEQLTTLMITHNMQQALNYGHRLIMMHRGKIMLDLNKDEKSRLTVQHLLEKFSSVTPDQMTDKMILA